jgi:hypothetical protein
MTHSWLLISLCYLYRMKIPRQAWPFVLLLCMGLLTLFVLRKNNAKTPSSTEQRNRTVKRNQPSSPQSPENNTTDDGFNRHPSELKYSKHARCRMGCRHIDEIEVVEVIEKGVINLRKSDMRASPDPRYALEGRTRDGQQVRIIVAQNGRSATIVTVIDLDTDWSCHCPGD